MLWVSTTFVKLIIRTSSICTLFSSLYSSPSSLHVLHCCCFAEFYVAFRYIYFLAIITHLWWDYFTHNTFCVLQRAHEDTKMVLYDHVNDSAKLSVGNPHSCLLWQADSCLNLCTVYWAGCFMEPSKQFKHKTFCTQEKRDSFIEKLKVLCWGDIPEIPIKTNMNLNRKTKTLYWSTKQKG